LALGHYDTGTGPPSPQNELWLDFTVRPGGVGVSAAIVPFEIAPSPAGSVFIHANATQPGTGIAGGRIACLPKAFSLRTAGHVPVELAKHRSDS